eukprot:c16621_g1_i3.p1 GENE.c16621_g1_i3~~c16621_g1_i3.p1  ORF type:complete len:296 (+),score=86.73 c16621_g1_i3:23-889(+)
MYLKVKKFIFSRNYFKDPWNILDFTQLCLFLCIFILYFNGCNSLKYIIAFAIYLKWFGILNYLQGFESTGALVRMVFQIIFDIRYIVVVLGILIFGVTSSLYAIFSQTGVSEYESVIRALFSVFNMLLFNVYDFNDFVVENKKANNNGENNDSEVIIAKVIFSVSMILVSIVLLNLLIALMSDSYERIQDQSALEIQKLRAKILLEIEMFMTEEELNNQENFPLYLHVLTEKGSDRSENKSQWLGVLGAIKAHAPSKNEIKIQVNEIKKELEELKQKMNTILEILQGQ